MDTLFSPIRLNQLEQLIEKSVSKAISNPINQVKPIEPQNTFLKQEEVADLFKVSKVTIWSWEKGGILKSYRIGNVKRFKLSELLASPKLINRTKK